MNKATGLINFGQYGGLCYVSVGYSFKDIRKSFKDKGWIAALDSCHAVIEASYACACMREVNGVYYYFLFIKNKWGGTAREYITLAHECLHLVQFHADGIFDRNREIENECYLHSYLMRQCLVLLKQKI